MSCTFVTSKARVFNKFHNSGIIGDNYEVLDVNQSNTLDSIVRGEAEKIIGKLPNDLVAVKLTSNESNKLVAIPNEDLFYRMDAAEGMFYEENEQYLSDHRYSVEEVEPINEEVLQSKLAELLEGIGVRIAYKNLGEVRGLADTVSKMVYLSMDKSDIGTLSEEAAHMFVKFIQSNDPRLYNRMSADITKLPIYQETKDKYMPVYNDITRVKDEAIGKALRDYLVLGRNDVSNTQIEELTSWFDRVLNLFKAALTRIGITSSRDYNNVFQITSDKILAGEFKGDFVGDRNYFDIDGSPLSKLDALDSQLRLGTQTQADGTEKRTYFLNDKPLKWSVTEKIKALSKSDNKFTGDTVQSEWGTKAHEDLKNLFKQKLDNTGNFKFVPNTNPNVLLALSQFADSIIAQFPNAQFRVEPKITDGKIAGGVDLLILDENGRLHILDYKFLSGDKRYLRPEWNDQLNEYKRILRVNYGFEKFGQLRIIPVTAKYSKLNDVTTLKDIEIGHNKLYTEASYLNPLPSPVERQGNKDIDQLLDFLQEELARTEATNPTNPTDRDVKFDRISALKKTIAQLQISQDVTPLTIIAENDLLRMQHIMKSVNTTDAELIELYQLSEHYKDFVTNGFTKDKDGNHIQELIAVSEFAQDNSKAIFAKLETMFNSREIDVNKPIKPSSWWSRLTRLSDYDIPAFQALQKILNKGFSEKEIKVRALKTELEGIIDQIKKETGKSGVEAFKPILQDKSPKLISTRDKSWYDMHKQVKSDPKTVKTLNKYFDNDAWKEYFDPIFEEYKKRTEKLTNAEELARNFKEKYKRDQGILQSNSRFFTKIPDNFLNKAWVENVRDKPDSGLAKLYNKYLEINKYANENSDTNIPRNFLPYIRKGTIETLASSGFNLKNWKDNAFNSLKSYEWESYEIDSNGQKVYKIPLKFGTEVGNRNLNEQSYDLGEMLLLWSEAVYENAYMQEIQPTTQLFKIALEKSKQIELSKTGKPLLKNGELRTISTDGETMSQFQEYLNMYLYGVKSETKDIDFMGFSMQKAVKGAVQFFSAKTLAFQPFSAISNVTGGFANALIIGSKGRYFTNTQLGKALTNMSDAKIRAFITLMDVDNNVFDRERANDLSINKVSKFVTWDNLFVLQKKGDWMLQNATLGAMAQNYTVKDGNIVKKTKDDKSLLELLDYDANGKVRIEGLDLTDNSHYTNLLSWRERVRSVNSEIIGSTSQQDKFLAGNTLLGQLVLQFRRWMLPMGTSRFGSLRYNKNLDEYQYGRYRSFASSIMDKKIFTALGEFIKEQQSPTFREILLDRYEEQKLLNPDLTYDQFKQLYNENAKSLIAEAIIFGAVVAILKGLKRGRDDDELNVVEKFLVRALSRTSSELSFWYSADSFLSIIQVPVPILSFMQGIVKLLGESKDQVMGELTGDEEAMINAKPGEALGKLFPGTNAYYRYMDELENEI